MIWERKYLATVEAPRILPTSNADFVLARERPPLPADLSLDLGGLLLPGLAELLTGSGPVLREWGLRHAASRSRGKSGWAISAKSPSSNNETRSGPSSFMGFRIVEALTSAIQSTPAP